MKTTTGNNKLLLLIRKEWVFFLSHLLLNYFIILMHFVSFLSFDISRNARDSFVLVFFFTFGPEKFNKLVLVVHFDQLKFGIDHQEGIPYKIYRTQVSSPKFRNLCSKSQNLLIIVIINIH